MKSNREVIVGLMKDELKEIAEKFSMPLAISEEEIKLTVNETEILVEISPDYAFVANIESLGEPISATDAEEFIRKLVGALGVQLNEELEAEDSFEEYIELLNSVASSKAKEIQEEFDIDPDEEELPSIEYQEDELTAEEMIKYGEAVFSETDTFDPNKELSEGMRLIKRIVTRPSVEDSKVLISIIFPTSFGAALIEQIEEDYFLGFVFDSMEIAVREEASAISKITADLYEVAALEAEYISDVEVAEGDEIKFKDDEESKIVESVSYKYKLIDNLWERVFEHIKFKDGSMMTKVPVIEFINGKRVQYSKPIYEVAKLALKSEGKIAIREAKVTRTPKGFILEDLETRERYDLDKVIAVNNKKLALSPLTEESQEEHKEYLRSQGLSEEDIEDTLKGSPLEKEILPATLMNEFSEVAEVIPTEENIVIKKEGQLMIIEELEDGYLLGIYSPEEVNVIRFDEIYDIVEKLKEVLNV